MKHKLYHVRKTAAPKVAFLLFALAAIAGMTPGSVSPATRVSTNEGCESGASHGLPIFCSDLGNLYHTWHTELWKCSGTSVISSRCSDDWGSQEDCCGIPNPQSCPAASCK